MCALHQAPRAGGEITSEAGLLEVETGEIDQIEVGAHPRLQPSSICESEELRGLPRQLVDHPFEGTTLAPGSIPRPMRQHEGREARITDQSRMGTPIAESELTAAMLAALPPQLLKDLNDTTLVANREVVSKVIDRIQEHAPDTAESLRALVQNFEIERIRELLAEVG